MHPVLFVTRNSNTPCNMSFVTSADMFNLLMSLVYVVLRVISMNPHCSLLTQLYLVNKSGI